MSKEKVINSIKTALCWLDKPMYKSELEHCRKCLKNALKELEEEK